MFNWLKNRRRKKLLVAPFPEQWLYVLNQNVRVYSQLSLTHQSSIERVVKLFVAEKYWEGHDGQVIDDEVRVTIAGTAALMLLGVKDFYFDNVKTIIVFPGSVKREWKHGMVIGEQVNAGEAWQSGQVVLSWRDVILGSRRFDDGRNLVIHEFAHCLDGLDGEMGGNLVFDDAVTTKRWQSVCDDEYQQLCQAKEFGRPSVIDHYGAINKAEFFACASEVFFEAPEQLQSAKPELYGLLTKYYRFDPAMV